jgi:hypothetical protein
MMAKCSCGCLACELGHHGECAWHCGEWSDEWEDRDYLREAVGIIRGHSRALPQLEHLKALYGIASEEKLLEASLKDPADQEAQ